MYHAFADVQTADKVKLDVPTVEEKVVTLKPSETVLRLADEIAERAEQIHAGNVDVHEDNMLKITSDGKKVALDGRWRTTILIDEQGIIQAVMPKVKPDTNADEILALLKD